jgi:drug/metabolite transporter (DMT)-like permease
VLLATVLALTAAVLHPAWNLAVKASPDRYSALWGQFLAGGIVSAVVLVAVGGVPLEAWRFAAASALIHVLYVRSLAGAYTHGDLSLAYPVARGGGALAAAVGGALALGDTLPPLGWLAVAVVVGGLASFVRPGAPRAALAWAGLLAMVIGVYTVVDAEGSRRSDGPTYVFAVTLLTALTVSVHGLLSGRLPALRAAARRGVRPMVLGGLGLVAAYGLVLVAVRYAPVGYVAALRESSVVIAALAGWRFLGEPFGRPRVAGAMVVVAGMALLVAVA